MIGKSDFARLIGDDDAHRAGFHDAVDEVAFTAEMFLGALAFDGITHGAVQHIGVELAFDQVVRRPRLHRFNVNLMVALPGQQNHRRPAVERLRFTQQFQTRPLAETIIQQTNIVFTTPDGGEPVIVIVDPVKVIAAVANPGNQIAGDDVVIFIIIYQQDFGRVAGHKWNQPSADGSSTTSNQYRPRTLMSSTSDLNVTGLVT